MTRSDVAWELLDSQHAPTSHQPVALKHKLNCCLPIPLIMSFLPTFAMLLAKLIGGGRRLTAAPVPPTMRGAAGRLSASLVRPLEWLPPPDQRLPRAAAHHQPAFTLQSIADGKGKECRTGVRRHEIMDVWTQWVTRMALKRGCQTQQQRCACCALDHQPASIDEQQKRGTEDVLSRVGNGNKQRCNVMPPPQRRGSGKDPDS
jgi:hypothetical protein